MAVLHSCSFVSPSPAVFAPSARTKPPPSAFASVPAGRRESSFPGLTLRQRPTAALRPGVVVRAQSRRGVPPAAGPADRYFVEERKHVMGRYNKIVGVDHGCLDSACLNLGVPNEISLDTIHGTIRAYVKIFVDVADASYSKSVRKDTVMSFLGALTGLASISHILLDTALEALSHTHPRASMSEYAFNCDVKGMRDEFNQQMYDLEDGISNASSAEICKVVIPIILEAMEITGSFVGLM
uniref:Uncharacterized protein n=1 Tax=Setaria italica TaxID=4555 RepID=K4A0Q8_SETIT